jgi:predicted ATPase
MLVVIGGGPGAGKTTVLGELQRRGRSRYYSDYGFAVTQP